ncbi:MAG: glycosyl hydrolase, partial [Rhodospirillaceae bacterium]
LGQTPRPETPGIDLPDGVQFDVNYTEGSDIGYRWFARTRQTPLFPFGYGLSYTAFDYSNLTVEGGQTVTVGFDVTNTGGAAGEAVPQIYLMSRTGRPLQRLIGFSKVALSSGQRQRVSVRVDPRLLADFDAGINGWRIPAGLYTIMVGRSAIERVLVGAATVDGQSLPP